MLREEDEFMGKVTKGTIGGMVKGMRRMLEELRKVMMGHHGRMVFVHLNYAL
jgi:hypothetical protein